jgi:hypothetical protein
LRIEVLRIERPPGRSIAFVAAAAVIAGGDEAKKDPSRES